MKRKTSNENLQDHSIPDDLLRNLSGGSGENSCEGRREEDCLAYGICIWNSKSKKCYT